MEANTVTHPTTGKTQEYRQLIWGPDRDIWNKSFVNEMGRLAQGVGNRVKDTNIIFCVDKKDVPFESKKSHMGN